eukprot:3945302-Amphidinium_carterae.1
MLAAAGGKQARGLRAVQVMSRGPLAPVVEEGQTRVGVFRTPFEYVCTASVKGFPTDELELVVPVDAQGAINFIVAQDVHLAS